MKINKKEKKVLDKVQRGYNSIASDFDNTRKKELWPKIKFFAKGISDGDRVLDLACGNGRLVQAFRDKRVDYIGVDNSEKLLELAKKNYPDYEFKEGDLISIFDSITRKRKYNYIFCLAALQHIPSKRLRLKVLKDIYELLEGGGKAIISNWNIWDSNHKAKIFKPSFHKLGFGYKDLFFYWKNSKGKKIGERYYHAFTKKELELLARKAGWQNIKIEKDQYNYWLILSK